jgi:hypothetical protein
VPSAAVANERITGTGKSGNACQGGRPSALRYTLAAAVPAKTAPVPSTPIANTPVAPNVGLQLWAPSVLRETPLEVPAYRTPPWIASARTSRSGRFDDDGAHAPPELL